MTKKFIKNKKKMKKELIRFYKKYRKNPDIVYVLESPMFGKPYTFRPATDNQGNMAINIYSDCLDFGLAHDGENIYIDDSDNRGSQTEKNLRKIIKKINKEFKGEK